MQSLKVLLAGCLAMGMAITSAIAPSYSYTVNREVSTKPVAGTFLIAADVGNDVSVYWKGSWYDAQIIATRGNKYKITYTGYDSSWDEWIGADRIRWKIGNGVSVYWKGSWYKATIIDVRGNKYKITYDGYDSSWDEWVGGNRIR